MSSQTRIVVPESPDVMKVLFEYNKYGNLALSTHRNREQHSKRR